MPGCCCILNAMLFFPVFRNQWANMYCSVSSKGTSETTSAKWLMGSSDIWCNKIITLILDTISQCICHRIVAKNTISANSDCFFFFFCAIETFRVSEMWGDKILNMKAFEFFTVHIWALLIMDSYWLEAIKSHTHSVPFDIQFTRFAPTFFACTACILYDATYCHIKNYIFCVCVCVCGPATIVQWIRASFAISLAFVCGFHTSHTRRMAAAMIGFTLYVMCDCAIPIHRS